MTIIYFFLKAILVIILVIINIYIHEGIHLITLRHYDGDGIIIYNILHPRVVITKTTENTRQHMNQILLMPLPEGIITYPPIIFLFFIGMKIQTIDMVFISLIIGLLMSFASSYYDINMCKNKKWEIEKI